MSNKDRDNRIEALGQALFNTLVVGGHGCHWTEVPEAIGLLLKTFATSIAAASEMPPAGMDQKLEGQALVDAIAEIMNQRFAEGYKRPVMVTFK